MSYINTKTNVNKCAPDLLNRRSVDVGSILGTVPSGPAETLQETYDASIPATINLNAINGGIQINPHVGSTEHISIGNWLEMDDSLANKKLVVGYSNTTGQEAHCIGWLNDMSGGQRNFVFGRNNDLSNVNCEDDFIIGYNNIINGDDIFIHGFGNVCNSGSIMGHNNNWGSHGCLTFGNANTGTTFMTNSLITGVGNTITGQLINGMVQGYANIIDTSQTSHTIGYQNNVSSAAEGITIGIRNDVNEDSEVCIGQDNNINGAGTTVIGRDNNFSAATCTNSYVVGYNNIGTGTEGMIHGYGNTVAAGYSVFGKSNTFTGPGNGVTVCGNSNTSTSWLTNSFIAGVGNNMINQIQDSVVIGKTNTVNNCQPTCVVGNDNDVRDSIRNAVCLGYSNILDGGSGNKNYQVCIGNNNSNYDEETISIGYNNSSNLRGISIGQNCGTTQDGTSNNILIGEDNNANSVTTVYGIAIGDGNTVEDKGLCIGRNNTQTVINGFIISPSDVAVINPQSTGLFAYTDGLTIVCNTNTVSANTNLPGSGNIDTTANEIFVQDKGTTSGSGTTVIGSFPLLVNSSYTGEVEVSMFRTGGTSGNVGDTWIETDAFSCYTDGVAIQTIWSSNLNTTGPGGGNPVIAFTNSGLNLQITSGGLSNEDITYIVNIRKVEYTR